MKKLSLILLIGIVVFSACSILQTITNVSRLKFKLGEVNNFSVNGISLNEKSRISDFTPSDLLKLSTIFATGKMPASFTLNILAKNPNDGTGGYAATDINLKAFDWDLFLNDTKTISGGIGAPVIVPGVGESAVIPLRVEIDLLKFFGSGSLDEVINLALKLGGKRGNTSAVKVVAKPILGTPIGDISYPEPITIVDTEFK